MISSIRTVPHYLAFIITVTAALLLAACDSSSLSPTEAGPDGAAESAVSVSFASNVGSASKAAPTGRLTDATGNVIELESVELVLRDVKFKSPGDNGAAEREAEVGPFLINVPLDSLPQIQVETDLPSGTWDRLELEIDDPSDEDDLNFPRDASIRVRGTWTPLNGPKTEFTFLSDAEGEREIQLSPPLEVGAPSTYNVTLMVKLDRWFRTADGQLIDPSTANNDGFNEDLVEDNIEHSFEGFEDNDQDGDDEDGEEDGDDDRSEGSVEVEAEGTIEALGDSTLTVNGRTWTIIEETRIFRADDEASIPFAELHVDQYVEVEGIERASGERWAKKVKIKDEDRGDDGPMDNEVEIEGRIRALGDSTITVRNQTWIVTDSTRIEDEDGASLEFSALREGDFVEIEGYKRGDSSLVAETVEREEEDDFSDDNGRQEVEAEGPIEALSQSTLTVSGITFRVIGQTQMESDGDAFSLSDLSVGDHVEVEGYRNAGGVVFATKIEREDEDNASTGDGDNEGDDDDSGDDSDGDDSDDDDE